MKKETEIDRPAPQISEVRNRPELHIDYERYAAFLDQSDLSEAEKREFIGSLWSLIVEFTSLGFGAHPMQEAQSHSTKKDRDGSDRTLSQTDAGMIDSITKPQQTRRVERRDMQTRGVAEREES